MTAAGGPLEQRPIEGVAPSELAEAFYTTDHRLRSQGRAQTAGRGVTSDLSIDETLLLHSIDWEPVELVCGASVVAIPQGTFTVSMGWDQLNLATGSFNRAAAGAIERLESECRGSDGHGVVGVKIDVKVAHHHVTAVMVGTAVRPIGSKQQGRTFASDLSTKDFCLLHGAGWEPLGLAFGASFVKVPRRSASTALKQAGANVELTNLTEAMYEAREQGMERMQSSALALGGTGVVDVKIEERPLHFASHVVAFTAWGTTIRLAGDEHRYLQPRTIVPLNDSATLFRVAALGH